MLNLCQSCVSRGGLPARWELFFPPFNTAGRIETQINYSASKNAEEQEVLSPHSTNQSALMTLDHLVWKTDRSGEQAGSWCICVKSPIQTGALFLPGHMEMYFVNKVMPNWQVMATSGDLFPRLPLGVCGGESSFFSSGADRAFRGQTTPQRYNPQCLKSVQHAEMVSAWQICISNEDISWQSHVLLQRAIFLSHAYAEQATVGKCKADLLVIVILMQKLLVDGIRRRHAAVHAMLWALAK